MLEFTRISAGYGIFKKFKCYLNFLPIVVLILSNMPFISYAETMSEKYEGVAKLRNGETAYIEKHNTTFTKSGKVLRAITEYTAAEGKLLGRLESDFSSSLTAPAHTFTDFITAERHGIRYEGSDKIVLFVHEKGKNEQVKVIDSSTVAGGIIVGCQGLHYYLRENFEDILNKKSIPIKMLIPGKLDYYNFVMRYVGENDGLVEFTIVIDSFFLRLFAPALTIKYDKRTKHLLFYEGLSNILDAERKMQNVTIEYSYHQKN